VRISHFASYRKKCKRNGRNLTSTQSNHTLSPEHQSQVKYTPVPEIIDPVFAKTSPKCSFCMTENERFGLVFVKTGSINSGTCMLFYVSSQLPPSFPLLQGHTTTQPLSSSPTTIPALPQFHRPTTIGSCVLIKCRGN
jgi:hypothetical protein